MSTSLQRLAIAVALFAVAYTTFLIQRRRPNKTLLHPPGPLTGEMPTENSWIKFQQWGKEYGDLVYVKERNILILNTTRVANDLLDKRASNYSDRQITPLMELSGIHYLFSVAKYSNEWRRDRKLFLQNFRQATIDRFYPYQYDKVQHFLRQLVNYPHEFMKHTMELSQSLVFSSLYGLDVHADDPFLNMAVEALEGIGKVMTPGAFPMIEWFPWLRYFPSWFPGCGFQNFAAQCLRNLETMNTVPFNMAMENQKKGLKSSLVTELAIQHEGDPEQMEAIKRMALISYSAAADTTMSSIGSFLLTLCLRPDIQRKGQEEIDRVIGQDRLPTFEDRSSLPYVEAIYREVMRLHPPLPNGVYHSTLRDDFYRGYHIPKGCLVIPNIWAMNRDEEIYSNPDEFIPERHLERPGGPFTNINDITAFGFGRRVCAGRYMADNTVWLAIVSVLATLTLGKAKDEKGDVIEIPGEYTTGMFRHPKPYQSSIAPRSKNAKDLIFSATFV
ncbi:cytochrome P450 1 [Lentinula raphanica]|uniref:Cytochrome P450 1 n=1 Tax=Lentinula raphanica TaxID=153919 RepID=A0AA38U8D7_9AGAR|nr:cytochrome P450 1 [Lentinula raphanica]